MQRAIGSIKVLAAIAVTATVAACGMMGGTGPSGAGGQVVTLEGRFEVPPNDSKAVGSATISVAADKSVKVKVIVSGLTPTAAHIHEGAFGANGPVVVPFTKVSDTEFVAAPDAKLTDAQFAAYKAGTLYVNVHSEKFKGGEIRGQVKGAQ